MTAYAAGLRASEIGRERVSDIDSKRMSLRVDQGKGNKNRYVPLSPRLLEQLREYWRRKRPEPWLFPNELLARPLGRDGAWHIYKRAKEKAGITKAGGSRAHDVEARPGETAPPVATDAITHDGQRASAELGALFWHALGGPEEAPEFGRWIRAPHTDPIIALSIGRGRRADYAVADRFSRTCAFPGAAVWLIEIGHARGDVPNAVAVWRSPGDDGGRETRCACIWTKERRGDAAKRQRCS